MTVQTTYSDNPSIGYEGEIFGIGPVQIVGRAVEGAAVRFGAPVERGTNDNQVGLVDAGTYEGVAIRAHEQEQRTALASPIGNGEKTYYDVEEPVSVMRKGSILVRVAEDVTRGAAAGYKTGTLRGEWFLAATLDVTAVSGAYFDTTATAGNLAVLVLS